MADQQIDRDKLRVAIRKMSKANVLCLLDEAIDLLPQSKLAKLVEQFWDPATLRPDRIAQGSLLNDVRAFEKASLSGKYYEAFRVDSRNYMEKYVGYDHDKYLAKARRIATPAQRKALRETP